MPHRALVTVLLLASIFSNAAFGQLRDPLGIQKESHGAQSVDEFIYRNDPDEILIPVQVLGAVAKPGLYHIPLKTDFIKLMSISGGPTHDAVTDEILLKKQNGRDVQTVDFERLMSHKEAVSPTLGSNDVVFIKTKEPVISNNTTLIISVVSGLLGIIVAGVALTKTSK